MPRLNRKKLKKPLLTLVIIGVFFFFFADFSYAKTKQEWLSEINQLLTDSTDSGVVKDKEKWLSELEQVAKEETGKRVVEVECVKNPDACPLPLKPLAIDESGDIEGVNLTPDVDEETSGVGIFIEKLKQALASLGIAFENKIVKVKELLAEKIIVKKAQFEKIEMVDQQTGEIYCTRIENGEWVKSKKECEANSIPVPIPSFSDGASTPSPQPSPEATAGAATPTPSLTPAITPISAATPSPTPSPDVTPAPDITPALTPDTTITPSPQPSPEAMAGAATPAPASSP